MPSDEEDIKPSYVRTVLNMFSVGAAAGVNATYFHQDLSGFSVYSGSEGLFLISSEEALNPENMTGVSNWLNNPQTTEGLNSRSPYSVPYPVLTDPLDNPLLRNRAVLINNDTAQLSYSAIPLGLPFTLYLTFDYQRVFRIGAGATFERMAAAEMSPSAYNDVLQAYTPDFRHTWNRKLFFMAGYQYHKWWDYSFVVDAHFGNFRLGNAFNRELATESFYFNIGIPVEKNISEYFRLIIRPSVDIKGYTMALNNAPAINTSMTTFNVQIGIELSYPKFPKCFLDACKTQMEHTHFHKKYRGQSIFKKQNPKIGQLHKGNKSQQINPIQKVSGDIGRIFGKKPRAYSSKLFKLRP